MGVIWHELRSRTRSWFIWSIGVVILLVLSMEKFATLTTSTAAVKQMLEQFPPTVQAVFGMNGLDMTNVVSYFGILFLYVAILLALHAGLLGADIIASEERDKTSEFLYTKPWSRRRILSSKLIAAALQMLMLGVVTYVATLILAARFINLGEVLRELTIYSAAYLVLQLLFFGLGFAMAAASHRPRFSGRTVSSLVLIGYFAYVISNLQPAFRFLTELSPFVQYDAKDIIASGSLGLAASIIYLAVGLGCVVLAYIVYDRRDLNT